MLEGGCRLHPVIAYRRTYLLVKLRDTLWSSSEPSFYAGKQVSSGMPNRDTVHKLKTYRVKVVGYLLLRCYG